MIERAERLLRTAHEKHGDVGRFQIRGGDPIRTRAKGDHRTEGPDAVALSYKGLVRLGPSIGALVGRAAAVAYARDAATAWTLLRELPIESVSEYQPYWALAAHVLERLGRNHEAGEAYERAIGLYEDHAVRDFLLRRASLLALGDTPTARCLSAR